MFEGVKHEKQNNRLYKKPDSRRFTELKLDVNEGQEVPTTLRSDGKSMQERTRNCDTKPTWYV